MWSIYSLASQQPPVRGLCIWCLAMTPAHRPDLMPRCLARCTSQACTAVPACGQVSCSMPPPPFLECMDTSLWAAGRCCKARAASPHCEAMLPCMQAKYCTAMPRCLACGAMLLSTTTAMWLGLWQPALMCAGKRPSRCNPQHGHSTVQAPQPLPRPSLAGNQPSRPTVWGCAPHGSTHGQCSPHCLPRGNRHRASALAVCNSTGRLPCPCKRQHWHCTTTPNVCSRNHFLRAGRTLGVTTRSCGQPACKVLRPKRAPWANVWAVLLRYCGDWRLDTKIHALCPMAAVCGHHRIRHGHHRATSQRCLRGYFLPIQPTARCQQSCVLCAKAARHRHQRPTKRSLFLSEGCI